MNIGQLTLKVTKELEIEQINLSVVVKPLVSSDTVGSITFLKGETAIKTEFAKYALEFSKRDGWRCRPLLRMKVLPIAKTKFLNNVLIAMVEEILDNE